jgi:hypothetical protein
VGNRNREFKPDYIDVAGGAADVVGAWLNVEGVDNLSFHVQWASADAIGVFKIEASDAGPVVNDSTRREEPGATPAPAVIYTEATTNPASNNGQHIISLTDRAERWVRFWYDRTSGTLTAMDVAFAGKGL